MSQRTADLTTKFRPAGVGICTKLKFMCGCKAKREPGCVFRGSVPYKCAACAKGVA